MSIELPSRREFVRAGSTTLLAAGASTLAGAMLTGCPSTPSAPFDLRISFTGLCMLCKQYGTRGDESTTSAYVLMPRAGKNTSAGPYGREPKIPAHRTGVYFDLAHLTPDAQSLSGILVKLYLNNRWLKLPTFALETPCFKPETPKSVVSLQDVLKCGEVQAYPDPPGPQRAWLATHMQFTQGHYGRVTPGAKFNFVEEQIPDTVKIQYNQEMPYVAQWVIPKIKPSPSGTTSLTGLSLQQYDTKSQGPDFPELFPIGNAIDLIVANVTREEEPDFADCPPLCPGPKTLATHFAAYYDLVDTTVNGSLVGSASDPTVPILLDCEVVKTEVCVRGTPYTCMLGGGG